MFDRAIFIMTVLTCGICAGVTLGAMYISVLPIWLGVSVIIATVVVTLLAKP